MISKILVGLTLSCVFLCPLMAASQAKPKAVASLPEIAWLMNELAPDQLQVITLIRGQLDPHHVDASPSFIFHLADADLFCFNGLALEAAWLDKATSKSANRKIQAGGSGYCDLSAQVEVLDAASERVDRSQGDVHPQGNPHYLMSLSGMQKAAEALLPYLKVLLPEQTQVLDENLSKLKERSQLELHQTQEEHKNSSLRVIEFHKEFAYVFKELKISSLGSIESLPGVPPSAAHLAIVAQRAQRENISYALFCEHHPSRYAKRFTELTKIQAIHWPCLLPEGKSYIKHWKELAEKLLKEG